MTTGHETIQLRLENRVAWITLNRPPLNILDVSMMQELDAVLERALPQCDFVIFNWPPSVILYWRPNPRSLASRRLSSAVFLPYPWSPCRASLECAQQCI